MSAPKKQIDRRKCDWSMANIEPLNDDTFNIIQSYDILCPCLRRKSMGSGANIWEENQREKKHEHIEHVVFVCYFSVRFLGILLYTKKPSHRTSNSCFFQAIPQLTHIFPSNCSNQAHPLVSLLPERTETVRGMGQTKLALQIHIFIIISIGV